MAKKPERNIITDRLVISKTGKTMEEWFDVLDKKGAKSMNHTEIFELVSSIDWCHRSDSGITTCSPPPMNGTEA